MDGALTFGAGVGSVVFVGPEPGPDPGLLSTLLAMNGDFVLVAEGNGDFSLSSEAWGWGLVLVLAVATSSRSFSLSATAMAARLYDPVFKSLSHNCMV